MSLVPEGIWIALRALKKLYSLPHCCKIVSENSKNDGLAKFWELLLVKKYKRWERKLTSVVCRNQNDRAIQLSMGTLCTDPLFLKYEDWDPENVHLI